MLFQLSFPNFRIHATIPYVYNIHNAITSYFPFILRANNVDWADTTDIILDRYPYEECPGASYVQSYNNFTFSLLIMRTAKAPTTSGKVDRELYQWYLPRHNPPNGTYAKSKLCEC